MSAPLEWPIAVLPFARLKWWPDAMVRTGGAALSGDEQVAVTDGGGSWRAQLPLGAVYGADRIRTYRSLVAQMQFGAVPIVVPVPDRPQQPRPGNPAVTATEIPHSDGSFHGDDAGYVNGGLLGSLAAPAALRATEIRIDFSAVGTLRGGEYFTIVHRTAGPRLYLLMRFIDDGGSTRNVMIWPPAREAMETGTIVDFGDPRCLMRLANPGEASALDLAPPWIARPVLQFVEWPADWAD
jgi:hypothetical protein